MRQCQHKVICYIIQFSPLGFLEDDIRSILTIGSRCYQTKTLGLSQGSTNIDNCILWCFSLFFPLGFKEFCLVYWNYFGFSHRVFQRFSSHFSENVFRGDILYCISLFFPQDFQGVIRLITRSQEDQIDYKTTRRRKLIKGECYEEIDQ